MKVLLKRNDAKSYVHRVTIAVTFLACGRGGEVALMTPDMTQFESAVDSVVFLWSQQKTGAQKYLPFPADAKSYFIDFYHCFACYFIVGGVNMFQSVDNLGEKWYFPALRGKDDGGTAQTVTAVLKSAAESVPHLKKDLITSTSLRIGAANTMAANPTVSLAELILTGGWQADFESNLWVYLLQLLPFMVIGVRALAGYKNARMETFTPRLDPIRHLIAEDSLQLLIVTLFKGVPSSDFGVNGRLWRFTEICFASIVMYWDDFVSDNVPKCPLSGGRNYKANIICNEVQDAFKRCHVSMDNVSLWAAMIRSDWHSRNLKALGGDKAPVEQLQSMVDALQDEILHLKQVHREESRQLRDHLSRLENAFDDSKKSIDELSTLLRTVMFSGTGTSNHFPCLSSSPLEKKKKRRHEADVSLSDVEQEAVMGSADAPEQCPMAYEELGEVMSGASSGSAGQTTEEAITKRKEAATPRYRPRPAKHIESIADMTFGTFFLMHQETDVLIEVCFTFKDSRDASRLQRIISYAKQNLPQDLLMFFSKPPPQNALAAWVSTLQQKAQASAAFLFSKIAEDERTYGLTKANVNSRSKSVNFPGIEARIEKVSKAKTKVIDTPLGQRKISAIFTSGNGNSK